MPYFPASITMPEERLFWISAPLSTPGDMQCLEHFSAKIIVTIMMKLRNLRNCKQLLYRSLHGLPHKNRCLGYLLLLLLTFLHHVVVTVRRLSVARGFLLRELPTIQTLFRVFNYRFSWEVAMSIQILVHRAELSVLSHGKMALIFVVCEHFTPTLAVLSTKLTYLNWQCTNGTTI